MTNDLENLSVSSVLDFYDALVSDLPEWDVVYGDSWVILKDRNSYHNVPDACLVPMSDGRILQICDGQFYFYSDYDHLLGSVKGDE